MPKTHEKGWSPLHKIPHLLDDKLTVGDALDTLEHLKSKGSALEKNIANTAWELLEEIRKEHDFYNGRVNVYNSVVKAPEQLPPDEIRKTNALEYQKLFDAGITVVATSNVVPDQLYKNGLNRQLFLPFIDLLLEHADVLNLASQTDYRRQKLETQPVFFFGPENETRSGIDQAWHTLTGGMEADPHHIDLMGRDFVVQRQFMGAARFGFKELCEAPLGARDYLRLSHHFHTFVLENVPRFDRARSDAAKRFILLIDTLYDRGDKLVASFEMDLDALSLDDKTAFEFQRTISRLIEMQSKDYLAAPRKDAAE